MWVAGQLAPRAMQHGASVSIDRLFGGAHQFAVKLLLVYGDPSSPGLRSEHFVSRLQHVAHVATVFMSMWTSPTIAARLKCTLRSFLFLMLDGKRLHS